MEEDVDFHHFIITRFNVNIYPTDFPPRLEDTWLGERLELFQKYCFPAVRAQSNQNFTWLILFDEQTPARYLGIIRAYAKYANLVPVLCGDYESILPTVRDKMRETAPDADWYVSTRLDNDDMLSVHYVHCLQEIVNSMDEAQLAPADTLYVNFPKGLQLQEGELYDFEDQTNAFVSLIERSDDPKTVFWVDHPSIYNVSPVIQAETRPLWLQVLHERNVYNYLRGTKLEQGDYSKDFPFLFSEGILKEP